MASRLCASLGFAPGAAATVGASFLSCARTLTTPEPKIRNVDNRVAAAILIARVILGSPPHLCLASEVRYAPLRRCLIKSHLYIRPLFQLHRIDESHLAVIQSKNHRLSANPFTEESDAAQQIAVGHAGASEDHFLPWSEVSRVID